MARVLTNEKNYYDIANTIRQMKNVNTTYKPREMAPALKDIYSNEVEGVLPLSFESNGMPLIDYRIDGANGGVGDLVTDVLDENYGKYKVPVIVRGKNSLALAEKTLTSNGISYAIDENGILTISGKINSGYSRSEVYLAGSYGSTDKLVDTGNYIVSAECDENISNINCIFGYHTSTKNFSVSGYREVSNENISFILIRITNTSYNFDNVKIKVMIRLASIEDDTYEPFTEPTTTNIYLDEPIEENESISLSDTEVYIPTIEGTNVLTTDTTVQPSNVYVQSRKDNDEIVFLTQVLEEGI